MAFTGETAAVPGMGPIYGVATLDNLKIWKPGGYYVCARATLSDFTILQAWSNSFQITPNP
jgi:hypothetical protein